MKGVGGGGGGAKCVKTNWKILFLSNSGRIEAKIIKMKLILNFWHFSAFLFLMVAG